MRNRVITRAMDEVNSLKKDLVSGQLTPEEIVDKCYEYYLKVDLGTALIGQEGERLSDEELAWLNQKESITGYLFSLWMDTSLTVNQEIAEITFSELSNDMTLSEVNDETLEERSEGIQERIVAPKEECKKRSKAIPDIEL